MDAVTQDQDRLEEERSRGFDFTGYKRTTLARRIRRRMSTLGVKTYPKYVDYLEVRPDEFPQLFNTILINVTGFFRDAAAWDSLRALVEERVARRPAGSPIRVWCAGCASGEEPYTLAMLFAESLGADQCAERVKIYATDVDEEALAEARLGMYSPKTLENVPPDLAEKYFTRIGTSFLFNKELRRAVIFGRHDLVQDAPISRVDLISCRNTLMYFNAETQTRILNRLHFALNDDGILFLGKAEMLLTHANLFTPLEMKLRVFGRTRGRTREAGPGEKKPRPPETGPSCARPGARDHQRGAPVDQRGAAGHERGAPPARRRAPRREHVIRSAPTRSRASPSSRSTSGFPSTSSLSPSVRASLRVRRASRSSTARRTAGSPCAAGSPSRP
jgi:two-component system CheB/CheR fusion protein